jgi:hypothetical protein
MPASKPDFQEEQQDRGAHAMKLFQPKISRRQLVAGATAGST